MKPHHYSMQRHKDGTVNQKQADQPPVQRPDSHFARAAYEWNNALQLAAERMWGQHAPLKR